MEKEIMRNKSRIVDIGEDVKALKQSVHEIDKSALPDIVARLERLEAWTAQMGPPYLVEPVGTVTGTTRPMPEGGTDPVRYPQQMGRVIRPEGTKEPVISNWAKDALGLGEPVAPAPGTYWHHYLGKMYRVVMVTNTQGDDPSKRDKYPKTVVYQGMDGKVWSRPLADWHRSMEQSHRPSWLGENTTEATNAELHGKLYAANKRLAGLEAVIAREQGQLDQMTIKKKALEKGIIERDESIRGLEAQLQLSRDRVAELEADLATAQAKRKRLHTHIVALSEMV